MTNEAQHTKTRSFTVILYQEDEMYIAECPEVGTVDQGETMEEAVNGLKEATRLYLEEFPLPESSPKFFTTIEVSKALSYRESLVRRQSRHWNA